jgi:2-methylcitrate dehydratase PrpD
VPIELGRELTSTHGVNAGNVARIEIFLPEERRNLAFSVARPPYRAGSAASSMLFQIAMILLDGKTDHARYAEFDSPELLQLTSRMEVTFEPGHDVVRYARVEITGDDGRQYVAAGDHYTFPPVDGLASLRSAGDRLLPPEKLERAARLISELESVPDVSELMECLTPRG